MRGRPVSVGRPSVGHGSVHLCVFAYVARVFMFTHTLMQMCVCVCREESIGSSGEAGE